jgi:hypothetical protein
MKGALSAKGRGWSLTWSLVGMLGLLSACTMQNSGSVMDASRGKNKPEQAAAALEQQGNAWINAGKPLKTDYLTPITAIRNPTIIVSKEKRRLYVMNADVVVRDYPIGLGFNPQGDKEKNADGRTPEGDFLVCRKGPAGHFTKALALSYPTRRHAEKALFHGLITPIEYREILGSHEKQLPPPGTTGIGGGVAIHGGGAHADWTDGSISLYDSDMEEIYAIAAQGTTVRIKP